MVSSLFQKLAGALPPSLKERLFFLGPGLILAVTVSGESGIAELLPGGSEYGYELLWVMVAALVFKFAFTNGIARYTLATGEDIFQGLRKVPGPKNWEVIFVMLIYAMEVIAYGGIALIAGIYLATLFPVGISSDIFTICTLALVFALLLSGSYALFERLTVAMAVALFAGIVYTLFAVPLPLGEVAAGFVPQIQDHLLPETMALMGAVGSGLNILLYSVWLHKKIGDRHGEEYFKAHMRSVTLDLVLAFLLIGLAAFGFFALGSAAASVSDAVSDDVLECIAYVFEGVPFALVVFLVTGYFTLFGGIAAGMQGRAEAITSILRSTVATNLSEKTVYRALVLAFAALILLATRIDDPAEVIRAVSAASSIMFAVMGFLLIYVDGRLPAYARGSNLWLVVMAAGSLLFLIVALLREETILEYGIPLIERIAVVTLVIYLVAQSKTMRDVIRWRMTLTDRVWLVLIFGMLSVYGTFRGIDAGGYLVNFRDLGPLIAGLLGGPLVGACAGAIGGVYRYSLGGWTALPCSLAPIAAGIIAGYASRRWKGRPTYLKMVVLSVIVESFHILVLVPLLTQASPELLIATIRTTLLPMIVTSSCGLMLFLYVMREQGLAGEDDVPAAGDPGTK